ncbi:MAG: nucleotidyl transferase AbiEii/AbiGii toxin family protein [Lachnospiraceae bacterium]|nr:nucleotidyl transferase AbiEii/AbiGii toxin family protein [Lachnospiraceae bacterium]
MIDVNAMIMKEIENGYGDANAQAKVCQDLILKAIATSRLNRNVTIKGGVVMRGKTKNVRRATQDIDLDFIRYSLSNESIDAFVKELNCLEGLKIVRVGRIQELKQQDYHGKRIFVRITDAKGFSIENKLDLGVHNRLDIEQEEFYFDIAYDSEGASLLINSNEQMIAEKLRSLLKFGTLSSRYKDIYDIYYLLQHADDEKLKKCLATFIFDDPGMRENDAKGIYRRINMVFKDKVYRRNLATRDANWLGVDTSVVINGILKFIENIQ